MCFPKPRQRSAAHTGSRFQTEPLPNKTIKTPPFDSVRGQSAPFDGFGRALPDSFELENCFQMESEGAKHRLEMGFQIKLERAREIPDQLDKITATMWNSGWDPQGGNVNLFTRDFGFVLTKSILVLLGGVLIFRSTEDVSHLSILWASSKFEAFPFHKVQKCLHRRTGETMASFMDGIAKQVSSP